MVLSRLEALPLVQRLPWRAIALVGLVVVAYHYSFQTLLDGLTLETPLAYLGFVPILALVVAWSHLARHPAPLPIHDRQLDYIVGTAMIGVAAAILLLMPASSAAFWLSRLDLVSLPFFVAGLIALLYGVRRLWALKVPILFLFLAWPAPYLPLVGDALRAFADLAASAVAAVTAIVPVARPAPGDQTLFFVGSGPAAFAVSVGSACSGVNGLVGYLILGGVLLDIGRGPRGGKAAWLGVGLALVWLLNVVRIVTILIVGARFGEAAALDVLHPYAGLVLFDVALLSMLAIAPRFGVSMSLPVVRPGTILRVPTPVRRVRVAVLVATVAAVVIALGDAGLARYSALAGELGNARIARLDALDPQVPGWQVSYVAAYTQARQFFGSAASWDRVLYSSTPVAALRSSIPIYVDVIDTQDASTLTAYGLEACYQFHGYRIESSADVAVGPGLSGQLIDYHDPTHGTDWSALWWEWPVTDGSRTSFERVVIFATGGPGASFAGAPAGPTVADRFQPIDDFLLGLGRTM
ncbi:MAG TPA: exosortase/archaeosortase family protein, partial [Candidatus Dormibacteraeota bacterium]|nr:exosortase/archaeosortase family protein [Candidatus Dormibacteraeota bacterium]